MQKVLSIQIGLTTTKVVEIEFKKKTNPKIFRSLIIKTPENTIEDGYIRDKEEFSTFLKNQLSVAGIKNKNVVFTVASNKILSREVLIPLVKDTKIDAVVKAESDDIFPMDISDHVLTYMILDRLEEVKQIRLMVFAAPGTLITNYYNFADLCGFHVEAIDYTGNSVYQWMKATADEETEFLLQVNEQGTLATIMVNGQLALQRSIAYGVNSVVEAVMEIDSLGITDIDTAEKLITSERMLNPSFDSCLSSLDTTEMSPEEIAQCEAKDIITDSLRMFVNNVQRVIEYYGTKYKKEAMAKIVIAGPGAMIQGLTDLMKNEMSIFVVAETELLDVTFKSKGEDDNVPFEQSGLLIPCIGASMAPVNFVPADYIAAEKKKSFLRVYLLLAAISILGCAAIMFFVIQNYNRAVDDRDALQTEYNQKQYITKLETEYLTKNAVFNEITAADASTFRYNEILNELIAELENKLPKTSIVHAMTSSGSIFMLNVSVPDKTTAAKLLMQLQLIPYVASTSVSAITEETDSTTGETQLTFTVTCVYQYIQEVDE